MEGTARAATPRRGSALQSSSNTRRRLRPRRSHSPYPSRPFPIPVRPFRHPVAAVVVRRATGCSAPRWLCGREFCRGTCRQLLQWSRSKLPNVGVLCADCWWTPQVGTAKGPPKFHGRMVARSYACGLLFCASSTHPSSGMALVCTHTISRTRWRDGGTRFMCCARRGERVW